MTKSGSQQQTNNSHTNTSNGNGTTVPTTNNTGNTRFRSVRVVLTACLELIIFASLLEGGKCCHVDGT
jgi:hypothetical protein